MIPTFNLYEIFTNQFIFLRYQNCQNHITFCHIINFFVDIFSEKKINRSESLYILALFGFCSHTKTDLEGYVADCGGSDKNTLFCHQSRFTFHFINFCGNWWNFLYLKLNWFQLCGGNKKVTCLNMSTSPRRAGRAYLGWVR